MSLWGLVQHHVPLGISHFDTLKLFVPNISCTNRIHGCSVTGWELWISDTQGQRMLSLIPGAICR